MMRKDRQKYQRCVNEIVRDMNKSIYNDDLWMGRFYAHQFFGEFHNYEDGSGGWLTVGLDLIDKRDNTTKQAYFQFLGPKGKNFFVYDLWIELNQFVCDQDTDNTTLATAVDYRKVGWNVK